MPKPTGLAKRIRDYVDAHPGSPGYEIADALGFKRSSGELTYLTKRGVIFKAGPRSSQRYYADQETAWKMHDQLVAEAAARKRERIKRQHAIDNLRRRGKRHAAGLRALNTRQNNQVITVDVADGQVIHPNVKVTIAAPFVDRRFGVNAGPGWKGQITAEGEARGAQG